MDSFIHVDWWAVAAGIFGVIVISLLHRIGVAIDGVSQAIRRTEKLLDKIDTRLTVIQQNTEPR